MPPSPAMRISPGREMRAENHKRGRSLESGILYREKDDDLALFNEVQNKERESFLLQSNDDFDDIFTTKLRYFSDYKLGISIPARGESSDLLNAEGDKNDYDWLITPPETPLFSSLDDETQPVNLAPRGRPRSQPVSISRSSTMEKGYRSGSRGSASPHRLSPSPRSGNNTLQSRSRPFSATHASPPPTLRHSSPSRLSPPPNKPSPAPRSNTPTPRRMSTGSSAPSRVRGTSPVKTSRGNSASPKIKAWQSNIPGFSSEAPPNLRTSLGDRPASYVRGSSPASRNGSRSGRQSMSPTASRSVSSSHSHERDPFSSQSKGSVASSVDDDVDSLQSVPVSISDHSAPRNVGTLPNNRAMGFSKKPGKVLSSSAPKRSFDLALRQMEKKGPQNMFRPLLSSVPSSTFYIGKASAHRSLISRNSSITTSSNASSDQGTSGAHDTEESEQNQEDVTSYSMKEQYSDEVFVMDQADALNEDVENRIIHESPSSWHDEIDKPSLVNSQLSIAESSSPLDTTGKYDSSDGNVTPDSSICSECGRGFRPGELLPEGDRLLCLECKYPEINSVPGETVGKITSLDIHGEERGPHEIVDRSTPIAESLPVTCTDEPETDHMNSISNDSQHSHSENPVISPIEEGKQNLEAGFGLNSKVDVSEGAGISLLLKRSSSGKGHFIQSRSFTASNISYDDFSYTRESVNSMRSSIGRSSVSVSSSMDLGSSRQTDPHFHRQSSGRKSDIENYRYEIPAKHKRSVSSLSGTSSHMFQVPSVANEDGFEVIVANMDKGAGETTFIDPREQSEAESICTDVEGSSVFRNAMETSVVSILASDAPQLHENFENSTNSSMDAEPSSAVLETSSNQGEDVVPSSCDGVEVPCQGSLDAISEMEIDNGDIRSNDSQSEIDSTNSKSCMDELPQPSVSRSQSDLAAASVEELGIADPLHGLTEESTVVLEARNGTKARSLTLEEATDAILFCSSIVHNLAYEAANIAIDKEKPPPMEALRPALTLVSDRRDVRSRNNTKRASKSQKARQKKLEADSKPASAVEESDDKSFPRIIGPPPNKGDSMKPPPKLESKCNCTIM